MSRINLLVSVRDAAEARAAVEGGADIIDVKEPSRGALGMADPDTIAAVVAAVGGRRLVSVATGELYGGSCGVGSQYGIDYVKVGLARARARWEQRLISWSTGDRCTIIAAYADHVRAKSPPVDAVLRWTIEHHATGLLIDTWQKDGRGLFDWLDEETLRTTIAQAKDAGLIIALAGSLSGQALRSAAALGPHVIGVRGAACAGNDRQGAVDAALVRALVEELRSA